MNLVLIDRSTNDELQAEYEVRLLDWTEERYWSDAPANRYWEFVDGEVIVHSPVDVGHTRVIGLLTFLLRGFCRARGAGEVLTGPSALRLRPGLAREPDLFVLSPEDAAHLRGCRIEAVPLLLIEVAGAESERRDLLEKAAEYRARGIPEYWGVLLRRQQVVVHRIGDAGQDPVPLIVSSGRLVSIGLPGFWVDLDWVWRQQSIDEIACLKTLLGVDFL